MLGLDPAADIQRAVIRMSEEHEILCNGPSMWRQVCTEGDGDPLLEFRVLI